jgi:hypothetical protein
MLCCLSFPPRGCFSGLRVEKETKNPAGKEVLRLIQDPFSDNTKRVSFHGLFMNCDLLVILCMLISHNDAYRPASTRAILEEQERSKREAFVSRR